MNYGFKVYLQDKDPRSTKLIRTSAAQLISCVQRSSSFSPILNSVFPCQYHIISTISSVPYHQYHIISVSQSLLDGDPVNTFFIRRGPIPNKFTRKYPSNFFLSSYTKLTLVLIINYDIIVKSVSTLIWCGMLTNIKLHLNYLSVTGPMKWDFRHIHEYYSLQNIFTIQYLFVKHAYKTQMTTSRISSRGPV